MTINPNYRNRRPVVTIFLCLSIPVLITGCVGPSTDLLLDVGKTYDIINYHDAIKNDDSLAIGFTAQHTFGELEGWFSLPYSDVDNVDNRDYEVSYEMIPESIKQSGQTIPIRITENLDDSLASIPIAEPVCLFQKNQQFKVKMILVRRKSSGEKFHTLIELQKPPIEYRSKWSYPVVIVGYPLVSAIDTIYVGGYYAYQLLIFPFGENWWPSPGSW